MLIFGRLLEAVQLLKVPRLLEGINSSLIAQGLPIYHITGTVFNVEYRLEPLKHKPRFVFKFSPFGLHLDQLYLTYLPTGEVVTAKTSGEA